MVVVEVQCYGDFNMPYTDSVWIHTRIDSFKPSNLSTDVSHDRDGEQTKRELKKLGFKCIKTKAVCCGGAY